ncbi:MAG: dihydrodipicolinate synthase family protein [Actinobacteria bacterium]|nr:MAG: dihydrodipicolinate synthase family protein [Actinomycetota bacterium]
MLGKLHGAIAATVTPLRDGGRSLDEASVAPLVRFLAEGAMDGVLTCGTTGEGVLLSVPERRRMTELCLESRPSGFAVAVHAGAQTTADTVALASHAREAGADAVAVIAPPYFPLDERELFDHFRNAAVACDPLPFYIYEFVGRSGYPVPIPVIERLRDEVPNLAGLKVSDTPFEAVKPYLLDGLDVFIGFEPLVLEGLAAGAVGAVSGLASAWPEVTAELVHRKTDAADARVKALREALRDLSLPAVAKQVLLNEGVLAHADVRLPLRGLIPEERGRVASL